MVALESLVLYIGVTLMIVITPGPDVIYVLTRGVSQGKKAAIAASLGASTGILAHTIFAIVGVSAIIKASAVLFMIVKFAGAAYLIYLGVRALIDKTHFDISGKLEGKQIKDIYKQSVITNVLNPKVAIFFLSFLPQFVNTESGPAWAQLLELGAIFMVITAIIFIIVGYFAANIGEYLKRSQYFANGIRYISGSVMCMLGIGLAAKES